MGYLPIFVDVAGRPCAVVGGGAVAQGKLSGLLERGAAVTVISPSADQRVAALAESGAIKWIRRRWRPGDLTGFELVFCAVDDPEASGMVAAEARKLGILVNVADQPDLCTFIAPAIVRRGELQIAISTSGASPAMAARVRASLEREFGAEYALSLVILRAARAFLRRLGLGAPERSSRLGALVDYDLAAMLRAGDGAALDSALRGTVGADLSALGLDAAVLFERAPSLARPHPE
jgi:precorrin-2 dehydrogenase/sirohydrochlorin ferrochelatase